MSCVLPGDSWCEDLPVALKRRGATAFYEVPETTLIFFFRIDSLSQKNLRKLASPGSAFHFQSTLSNFRTLKPDLIDRARSTSGLYLFWRLKYYARVSDLSCRERRYDTAALDVNWNDKRIQITM